MLGVVLDPTMKQIEKVFGGPVDRRRKYIIDPDWMGEGLTYVLCEIRATRPCTGCSCDYEWPCDCCAERGGGCDECGYTGKRVRGMWIPFHWSMNREED